MANVSTYMVLHVWEKASSVAGYDPDIWRKDFAGAWIRKIHMACIQSMDGKLIIYNHCQKAELMIWGILHLFIGKIIKQRGLITQFLIHQSLLMGIET